MEDLGGSVRPEKKPKGRIRLLIAGLTLSVIALVAAVWIGYFEFRHPPDEPVLLEGAVQSKGQPVHLLLAEETASGRRLLATSLVPTTDSYLFRLPPGTTGNVSLVARSAGFDSMSQTVSASRSVTLPLIELKAKTPPPRPPLEERTVTVTSDSVSSGEGAAFSSAYVLCSDTRPGAVPDDFAIKASEFHLEGDRSCGAWSTCEQMVNTPAKACWAFRLQGHEECVVPKMFGNRTCDPRPASRGVLTLHLVKKVPEQSADSNKERRTVYVQYDGTGARNAGAAETVCTQLERDGVRCVDVTVGSFDGPPRVAYFNPDDEGAAKGLADQLRGRYGVLVVVPFRESGPVVRSSVNPKGQFELWLRERAGS